MRVGTTYEGWDNLCRKGQGGDNLCDWERTWQICVKRGYRAWRICVKRGYRAQATTGKQPIGNLKKLTPRQGVDGAGREGGLSLSHSTICMHMCCPGPALGNSWTRTPIEAKTDAVMRAKSEEPCLAS